MRFAEREIQVEMREEEETRQPSAFTLAGARHEVAEVLATWGGAGFAAGRNPWKGASRTYFRVRATDGAVYELAADWDPRRRKERWLLHRQLTEAATLAPEAAPEAPTAPEAPATAPARRRPRAGRRGGEARAAAPQESGDSSSP